MLNLIKDRLKDWRILVVDDEPDSLEVAYRWLKLAGANVSMAKNGQEGLDIARDLLPHFIIADLTMPVMDGWEMLYELRQDPATAHIPVIALTAHAMRSTKERATQAGFVSHISKPLNPNKFVEQVIQIIDGVPELGPYPITD